MLGSLLASARVRIFLYAKDVDMRKSFDGLHAIVQTEFNRDILLGDLFLFLNRRRDRLKLLHWDGDGLAIWAKRLECGTFQRPPPGAAQHIEIDAPMLAMLLSGIDLSQVKRRRRFTTTARSDEHISPIPAIVAPTISS